MKSLKYTAIIERSKDSYWAYIPDLEGVSGAGNNVSEAKNSMFEGLQIQQELGNIPNANYSIEYEFDVISLLNYFKGILTNAAFERFTGINQMQMSHNAPFGKKGLGQISSNKYQKVRAQIETIFSNNK